MINFFKTIFEVREQIISLNQFHNDINSFWVMKTIEESDYMRMIDFQQKTNFKSNRLTSSLSQILLFIHLYGHSCVRWQMNTTKNLSITSFANFLYNFIIFYYWKILRIFYQLTILIKWVSWIVFPPLWTLLLIFQTAFSFFLDWWFGDFLYFFNELIFLFQQFINDGDSRFFHY